MPAEWDESKIKVTSCLPIRQVLIQTQEIAAEYGPTLSISVQDCSQMQDENGAQKKFGFVSFENHEDAEKCVQEMNGKEYGDRKLYVSRAQKKVRI